MKLCELYEDMISAFIDGALEEKDRAALMEHMAVCPDCQTYFNEQIALHDALMGDAAEIQPPENFTADVMAHVRFNPQEKRRKPAVRWPQWAALAACCAIAAVGLWRGMPGQVDRPAVIAAAEDTAAPEEDACADAPRAVQAEDTAELPPAEQAADTGGNTLETAPEVPPMLNSAPPPATPESGTKNQEIQLDAGTGAVTAAEPPEEPAVPDAHMAVEDGPARPVPAAEMPQAGPEEDLTAPPEKRTVGTAPVSYTTVIAAGPAAAAWVEETLGLPWTAGERYELSAEEYAQLLEVLQASGEDYTELPGQENNEGFLLIAENAMKNQSETD